MQDFTSELETTLQETYNRKLEAMRDFLIDRLEKGLELFIEMGMMFNSSAPPILTPPHLVVATIDSL